MTEKITVIRTSHGKDNPYFMMARATAQNRDLSFEARGLLAYLLSKPNNWEVKIPDLYQGCGKTKVYGIIEDLIKARYMEREPERGERGRILRWVYRVYETPLPKADAPAAPEPAPLEVPEIPPPPLSGFQEVDNQEQVAQEVDNQLLVKRTLHNRESLDSTDITEEKDSASDDASPASVTDVTPPIQEKGVEEAQPDTPPVVPPAAERPRDLVFDAIKAGWKLETGSFVAKIKKLLTGNFTPSGNKKTDHTNRLWIENNITPPMDADEINRFVEWYDLTTNGCTLPEDPEKICKWVQKGRAVEYAIEGGEPEAPPLKFLRPPSLPIVAPIVPPVSEDTLPGEDDYIDGDELARARELFQAITARIAGGEPEHA